MNTNRWPSFTLHREDWRRLHSQRVKVKHHEPKREGKESRTKHTQDCYVQSQMSRWVDIIRRSGKFMIWRGAKSSTESGMSKHKINKGILELTSKSFKKQIIFPSFKNLRRDSHKLYVVWKAWNICDTTQGRAIPKRPKIKERGRL